MKIEKLTPEQEARLDEYRDKWLAIGLSCEPCDIEKARPFVNMAYEAGGLKPPPVVLLMDSPVSGAICSMLLKNGKMGKKPTQAKALELVQKEMNGKTWKELTALASPHIGDQVYGSHDAGWLSFYDFFLEVVGLECCEKLRGLIGIAKTCGWWAPYDDVAILQHRHCELHRDSEGRLHNETGPSVLYRDGFGVWAWHGVRVPRLVVEEPEKITLPMIENEQNAEVRRVMIERYGSGRYMTDSGVNPVHSDDFGTLYIKEQGELPALAVVKVANSTREKDGSYKDYFLRCHPELRPMIHKGLTWLQGEGDPTIEQPPGDFVLGRAQELTARNAVASTFGFRGKDYAPGQET